MFIWSRVTFEFNILALMVQTKNSVTNDLYELSILLWNQQLRFKISIMLFLSNTMDQ